MSLSEPSTITWEDHWRSITPPESAWERELHARLRRELTVVPPFRVWSNFEFIDLHGATFAVDLLVVTPAGVFVIECFPGDGVVHVGARQWRWIDGQGRAHVLEDPVQRVRDRAERMRELLEHHTPHAHAPRLHGLVLAPRLDLRIERDAPDLGAGLVGLSGHPDLPDVLAALERGELPGQPAPAPINEGVLDRLEVALEQVGLEPARGRRKVGDWRCHTLLETSDNHQDYRATHMRDASRTRHVRIFFNPRGVSRSQRQRLENAARREHELVTSLDHPHILSAHEFVQDGRPALVFEDPDGAIRLDHYLTLREAGDLGPGKLNMRQRLDLLGQIAEALDYAHRKRVVHRALTPQSVLVVPGRGPQDGPRALVYNWQAALDRERQTGTQHVQDYLTDASAAYAPPESHSGQSLTEASDIWGLGAIAYLLFRGEPPASSPADLLDRLMHEEGLSLAARADGIPGPLEELVRQSTHYRPGERPASAAAFLQRLDAIRASLQPASPEPPDPLEAAPGEVLDDTWEVLRRLGSGASATALLARDASGHERVLKISHTERDAARLEHEARDLEALDDAALIVGLHEVTEVGGRRALVLEYAGESLRERLARSRLSLDDLRRFGEDLCQIVTALERHHVWHRDIKPANLGVGSPSGSTRQLMLFDFSLANARAESVEVGTAAYRDPMLMGRGRWDEHADRWAAAVTLHEMAAGSLPRWPEQAVPMLEQDARIQIEADALPASVRTELLEFFARALHRDVAARFETGEQMLQRWRQIFEDTTHTAHDEVSSSIEGATRETPIRELELSATAREALDRLEIHDVGGLVDEHPQSIYFQHGTSAQVRAELRELRKKLIARLPEVQRPERLEDDRDRDFSIISLDRCAHYAFRSSEDNTLARAMGLTDLDEALPTPDRRALARRLGEERAEFERGFLEIAESWERMTSLRPLREDVHALIVRDGGVVTDEELARALLGRRGSVTVEPRRRLALAATLARVALEAERTTDAPRFMLQRVGPTAFFHDTTEETSRARVDLLPRLGDRADALASTDPLLGEQRAYLALLEVCHSAGVEPPRSGRLLALAAAASSHAALSSRRELYPRGMPARRALKLASGAITGRAELSDEELRERVRVRYPEAEALPPREALEQLLEQLHLPLRWDAQRGAFVSTAPRRLHLTGSLGSTSSIYSALEDGEAYDLERLDEDLSQALRYGGFRVLTCAQRHMRRAQDRLLSRFEGLERVSVDRIWIEAMTEAGQQGRRKLSLEHLIQADQPDAPDRIRAQFGNFLTRAHQLAEARLGDYIGRDILMVHPGLLGRYADHGSMQVLERWRDRVNTDAGPHTLWLLVPADEQFDDPRIEGPHRAPHEPRRDRAAAAQVAVPVVALRVLTILRGAPCRSTGKT